MPILTYATIRTTRYRCDSSGRLNVNATILVYGLRLTCDKPNQIPDTLSDKPSCEHPDDSTELSLATIPISSTPRRQIVAEPSDKPSQSLRQANSPNKTLRHAEPK